MKRNLHHSLYQFSAKCHVEHLHYFAEALFFSRLCGLSWAQRHYWPDSAALVREFLRSTALCQEDTTLREEQIMRQALLGDVLLNRWRGRLRHLRPAQLADIVSVHDYEKFMTAYRQRRGVVLVMYHSFAMRFVSPWLDSAGISPMMVVQPARMFAEFVGIDRATLSPSMDPFLNAQQLHIAGKCLANAGVVHILQDNQKGFGRIVAVPFLQRVRSFHGSFAELALLYGSVVIPVSASHDLRGRIDIVFHDPLNLGDDRQSRQERIESAVRQYVAFMHRQWVRAPGSLTLNVMKKYI